jgi:hypothetical protein
LTKHYGFARLSQHAKQVLEYCDHTTLEKPSGDGSFDNLSWAFMMRWRSSIAKYIMCCLFALTNDTNQARLRASRLLGNELTATWFHSTTSPFRWKRAIAKMRSDLLSKRLFFAGCFGLPWLWVVHVLYHRQGSEDENDDEGTTTILNPDDRT